MLLYMIEVRIVRVEYDIDFHRENPSMTRRIAIVLFMLFLMPSLSFGQIHENGDVTKTVTVHVTRPEAPKPIPSSVFGSFLEPIGKSTYGGLWADLIENPSFEEGLWSVEGIESLVRDRPTLRRASHLGLPLPWEPLTDQGTRYLPVRGDAANSEQSLLMMALPGKEVGVRQRIYLPVKRQLTYIASIYLKRVSGSEEVTISLRDRDKPDSILASANISAISPVWKKYVVTLSVPVSKAVPLAPSDLVISIHNETRVLVDQVSLMPADNIDGLDPEEVAMARDLHSPLIRFGGNFTSAYDWRDGVGPRDKRVSKINISWGIPEYNTFGTDEFLQFCRLIHAEPQIALNLGSDTPEHAAEWVEYVNNRWPKLDGSHTGGLLWELGNELWGDFQVGYPSLERVAAKTFETSEAVRKVDSHARLVATGADEDHFAEWNAVQLSNPPGTFDYLSTHFVVGDQMLLKGATKEFTTAALLALPIGLENRLKAIHEQIQASSHRDRVKTAFTEWLLYARNSSDPNYTNMGGAVFAAGFLNSILRNSDIVPISDMTGIIEFGGIWKKRGIVFGTPAYWVLREYANANPTSLLTVVSDSPSYSVSNGSKRLPEITDVPYLDVTASTTEGGRELLLFCVNRNPQYDLSAKFDFASLGKLQSEAMVSTLQAKSLTVTNTEDAPDTVRPSRRKEPFKGFFHHSFPAGSVTVITIRFQ